MAWAGWKNQWKNLIFTFLYCFWPKQWEKVVPKVKFLVWEESVFLGQSSEYLLIESGSVLKRITASSNTKCLPGYEKMVW